MNLMCVMEGETVQFLKHVLVIVVILVIIANIQFAIIFLQIILQFVLVMDLVLMLILVVALPIILVHNVIFISVMEFHMILEMFVMVMVNVWHMITATVQQDILKTIVNITIVSM
jgi:hypothetical protein